LGVALAGLRGLLEAVELLEAVARLARLLGVEGAELELLGVLIQPNMLDLLAGLAAAGAVLPARSTGRVTPCGARVRASYEPFRELSESASSDKSSSLEATAASTSASASWPCVEAIAQAEMVIMISASASSGAQVLGAARSSTRVGILPSMRG
jgi:hypothetical protein